MHDSQEMVLDINLMKCRFIGFLTQSAVQMNAGKRDKQILEIEQLVLTQTEKFLQFV